MLNEEQFFGQRASHTVAVAAVRIQVASRTEQTFAGAGRRQQHEGIGTPAASTSGL